MPSPPLPRQAGSRASRADSAQCATLITHTGFDGTQEELRAALAANARGMHCVTFEGSGQGAVIREQRLPAYIANGGIYDYMAPNLPPGMTRQAAAAWIRDDPQGADRLFRDLMSASTDTRWAVQNGMFTFASSSPAAWFLAALDYTMAGVAQQIRCPTLVIDTEAERAFAGQAKILYDALTCQKTFLMFTTEEGAEDHCQVGSPLLSAQRTFDWLQETLSHTRPQYRMSSPAGRHDRDVGLLQKRR